VSSIACAGQCWNIFLSFNAANLLFTTFIFSDSCSGRIETYFDWKGKNFAGELYYIKTIKFRDGFSALLRLETELRLSVGLQGSCCFNSWCLFFLRYSKSSF
jgi:hypothetical protein